MDPGSYIHNHRAIKDIPRTVITGKLFYMDSILLNIRFLKCTSSTLFVEENTLVSVLAHLAVRYCDVCNLR